jgi:hypothetical protein
MNRSESQKRPPKERQSLYLWGKRYPIHMDETGRVLHVERGHSILTLELPPDAPTPKPEEGLDAWYREEPRNRAMGLIPKWEKIIGVKVKRLVITAMEKQQSSSKTESGTIRLNTDLAKNPLDCLEYALVREMVRLQEPIRSTCFEELMDRFMPGWRAHRDRLNTLPVGHEMGA